MIKKAKNQFNVSRKYIFLALVFVVSLLASVSMFPQKAYAAPKCFDPTTGNGGLTYYKQSNCDSSVNGFDPSVDSEQTLVCFIKGASYSRKNCLEVAAINKACADAGCVAGATADGSGGGDPMANNPTPDGGLDPVPETCDGRQSGRGLEACLKDNTIVIWIQNFINFLSIGVGVIITIMIIVGGIQYSAAGGNPQLVAAAKKKIFNAIFALLAYIFLYAVLQWLVPGGIF